ncbi:MAG: hypothetical protein JWO19_3719 [Bryobacterales bacterium]|nr:hypothetical protein [Bryobacterales bacterium]
MNNFVFNDHDGDLTAPPPDFDLDPVEWDERLSPLRIRFHNDDPLRRGREFSLPSTGGMKAIPQILPQASKPQLPMYSISLRTTWIQALILILRGLD